MSHSIEYQEALKRSVCQFAKDDQMSSLIQIICSKKNWHTKHQQTLNKQPQRFTCLFHLFIKLLCVLLINPLMMLHKFAFYYFLKLTVTDYVLSQTPQIISVILVEVMKVNVLVVQYFCFWPQGGNVASCCRSTPAPVDLHLICGTDIHPCRSFSHVCLILVSLLSSLLFWLCFD